MSTNVQASRAQIGEPHAMATIRLERHIAVAPQDAWDALADWGELHVRLVPGFVTDAQLDGDDRIVTFFNGTTVRERFVSSDAQTQRLVWSIADGPYSHHNGAAQALADPDGGTRFVWTADLLPDELAAVTEELMQRGIETIKRTLEAV
jgi:Polyketide cyclase / dehydrase and lipid transport